MDGHEYLTGAADKTQLFWYVAFRSYTQHA